MSVEEKIEVKECPTDTEHPADDGKENSPELTMQNVHIFFQGLQVKYTRPGYARPDLPSSLTVTSWLVMASWRLYTLFLQVNRL
jgi:hypothetical protein